MCHPFMEDAMRLDPSILVLITLGAFLLGASPWSDDDTNPDNNLVVKENTMGKTRLKISIGRTINLGNYESLRLEEGMEIDVEDDEDIGEARRLLLTSLDAQVDKDAKVLASRIKTRAK